MRSRTLASFGILIGIGIVAILGGIALAAELNQSEGTTLQGKESPGEVHTRGLNCTGSCTAVGDGALKSMPAPGGSNTAVGVGTLGYMSKGDLNTALGAGAGGNNRGGTGNTALGAFSLRYSLPFGCPEDYCWVGNSGNYNTAAGYASLQVNAGGSYNTAIGNAALMSNTTAHYNVAVGSSALEQNTTGTNNTAVGTVALQANTTGPDNTAVGMNALKKNTTGGGNVAMGVSALAASTTANANTAVGWQALGANTTGYLNVAVGHSSLMTNTTGTSNAALGFKALAGNTAGGANAAYGADALEFNTIGMNNTALGAVALQHNTSGNNNTALGYQAGLNQTTGNNNVYINNLGLAGENGTIRIGTPTVQVRTFIAGVSGVPVSGAPVVVDANGQLGVQASSLRYKDDIRDIAEASRGLQKLRPVTFKYKAEVAGSATDEAREYGLIAEEVAEIYPDLVGRDGDGQIMTVKYHELIPMLLNELQRQQRKNEELEARMARLEK